MPSGQTLYLMMFVGNLACTSHMLQYSSSRSYEHSRSLQSVLCPGVVTVLICSFFVAALLFVYINLKNGGKIIHIFTKLICSFFVAALLFVYINLKNGGKIIHIFTNRQTFSYLFCIFRRIGIDFYYSFIISLYLCTRSIKSSARKGDSPTEL